MSGDEEARVRVTLTEMQQRISKGPYNALGVTHTASPQDVRSAFLELTKRFHPARFARMSIELQKFSNEVFLGLRSAHDLLVTGSSLRGGGKAGSGSGGFPPVAEGSGSTPAVVAAQSVAAQKPATQRIAVAQPAGSKPTPPQGVPIVGGARRPTPPQGLPIVRPPQQASPPPQGQPGTRPSTPQHLAPAPQPPRAPSPPPAAPPLPPKPSALAPQTLRYNNDPPKQPAAAFDERAALEQALELVNAKSWPAARQALHALAARVPQSKHYRALLCYTRGREAQVANRPEEALLEFQRALQLDPELAQAKQALADIQRRR